MQSVGRVIVLLVLLMVMDISTSCGQIEDLRLHYLAELPELDGNNVYDIAQDGDGFMWFATYTGLYRFFPAQWDPKLGIHVT